jgi:WD40 repeat protein
VLTAISAVVLLLLLAVAGLAANNAQIRQERDNTDAARREADGNAQTAKAQRTEAEKQRDDARYRSYISRMREAQRVWSEGNTNLLLELLDSCRPQNDEPDLRGWEWRYFQTQCHGDLATLETEYLSVDSLAWSPDGRQLAATSAREIRIQVWDVATGEKRVIVPTPPGTPSDVTWSPDGRRLAWADDQGTFRIWNVGENKQEQTVSFPYSLSGPLQLSPDGRWLAQLLNGDPAQIVVWDVATGREAFTLTIPVGELPAILAWSPDGKHLATAGNFQSSKTAGNERVIVWDMTARKEGLSFAIGPGLCRSLVWSPDGARLALAYENGLKVYDSATGKEVLALPGAFRVDWSPDSKQIAAPSAVFRQAVKVWNAATGAEVLTFRGHAAMPFCLKWSPDGHRLASAAGDAIKVWDVAAEPGSVALDGFTRPVHAVSWSRDGRRLAAQADDGTIKTWDWATRKELASIAAENCVEHIAWAPDNRRIAAPVERNSAVAVWDAGTGERLLTFATTRKATGRNTKVVVTWSPDGRLLAANWLNGSPRYWDTSTGQEVAALEDIAGGAAMPLVWSPDGRRLAVNTSDGDICVYNAEKWTLDVVLRGAVKDYLWGYHLSLAWSPDGRLLAAAERNKVAVWDVAAQQKICLLSGPSEAVLCLSWSPDGQRLAAAERDRSVVVWETRTGQEVLTLTDAARTVAWSPDGRWLAAGGPRQLRPRLGRFSRTPCRRARPAGQSDRTDRTRA